MSIQNSAICAMCILSGFIQACRGADASTGSPSPSATAATAATTAAASASAAPAAALQPAKAKIGGKSLNQATMSDIGDALKKQGYGYKSGGGMAMGSTETVTVKAEKGKDLAVVSLIRPTGKPDESGSMKMSSASNQAASFEAKGATYLEKDAEVLLAVVIEGKKDEAEKVLNAILEK